MILAADIRVKNIYYRKHGKGWTETVMTEEIIGGIFSDSPEYALNDFEGVPLTEKSLKRCDLEQLKKIKDVFLYVLNSRSKSYWFGVGVTRLEVKYFHQIQNIYYHLVGEELKIDDKTLRQII